MRMRTQSAAIKHIRAHDPDSAITPWALRSMVLSGQIPSVQVGRKRLIDLDTLNLYLSPETESTNINNGDIYGTVRPVRIAKSR